MREPGDPVRDQQEAANSEAVQTFETFAKHNAHRYTAPRAVARKDLANSPSARVIDKWMAAAKDETTGRACTHISDSPQVVYAAGALPGIAFCPACLGPHLSNKISEDNRLFGGRECDACGTYSKTGHEGILNIASIILMVSMCEECGELAKNE